jgi:hypothetical protein
VESLWLVVSWWQSLLSHFAQAVIAAAVAGIGVGQDVHIAMIGADDAGDFEPIGGFQVGVAFKVVVVEGAGSEFDGEVVVCFSDGIDVEAALEKEVVGF